MPEEDAPKNYYVAFGSVDSYVDEAVKRANGGHLVVPAYPEPSESKVADTPQQRKE